MGLFDAKYCGICGNKLGLLGTTKLEDGHLCKDCTSKLSPYFSRRHQTLDGVKTHLAYREENLKAVSSLKADKSYGDAQKFWIDTAGNRFVISRSADFTRTNPDIFSFGDIVSIEKVIDEDENEIFDKDAEGKKISFVPPRYEYEYKFIIKMTVRNKNISDDIRAELFSSKNSETYHDETFFKYNALTNELISTLVPGTVIEEELPGTQAPAETPVYASRYLRIIRCTNCGWISEGPAIPRFCPKCADQITLEDIDVVERESGVSILF